MQIQVSGKQIDIGDALRGHVMARLDAIVSKYFGDPVDGAVAFSRDGHEYRADCSVHLRSGMILQAQGRSTDIYASFDQAADRMETRLRRYKTRLKGHHQRASAPEFPAHSFVIAGEIEGGDEPLSLEPLVIAESPSVVRTFSVGEAVMQLNLSDAPVLLFRNAASGGLNVVYKRSDGNVGWIDPSFDPSKQKN